VGNGERSGEAEGRIKSSSSIDYKAKISYSRFSPKGGACSLTIANRSRLMVPPPSARGSPRALCRATHNERDGGGLVLLMDWCIGIGNEDRQEQHRARSMGVVAKGLVCSSYREQQSKNVALSRIAEMVSAGATFRSQSPCKSMAVPR
jgi:hypothetical protein